MASNYIKLIGSRKLLSHNPIIPNYQRIIDLNKVKDIVDYQLGHIKRYGYHNFLGTINIHYLTPTKEFYLVDGQHRYEAIKRLFNIHSQDHKYYVEFVHVETPEKLRENFNLLNKNTPLPELDFMIDKNVVEKTAMHYQIEYPKIWSKTARAKRPQLFFNYFQEALGFIASELSIENYNALIDVVDKKNNDISKWNFSVYKDIAHARDFKDIKEHMLKNAQEQGFYLGLFSHITNAKYSYEWAREIVQQYSGKDIPKARKRKTPIPKGVKNGCWDKYAGADRGEWKCPVCCVTKINSKDFDAGHIVSEKHGGDVSINNLIPICSMCNRSMGTMDMRDYVKTHYPNNKEFFRILQCI